MPDNEHDDSIEAKPVPLNRATAALMLRDIEIPRLRKAAEGLRYLGERVDRLLVDGAIGIEAVIEGLEEYVRQHERTDGGGVR